MEAEHRKARDVCQPNGTCEQSGTGIADEGALATRREVLAGAFAVSGLAFSGLSEPAVARDDPVPAPTLASSPQTVQKIGELRSENGKLRAVVTVKNEERMIPEDPSALTPARKAMLRYFEGKDSAGRVVWPPPPRQAGVLRPPYPGPTLRARIGDQVEITYLNHIGVDDFAGSIDRVETGAGGCDETIDPLAAKDGKAVRIYPDLAGDRPPACFHGSSTVNFHFHGTHVTPDGLGDNVLLHLRPNPKVTETSVQSEFEQIFTAGPPSRWSDLPETWRNEQLRLLQDYDDTAVWQGKRGTPGHPTLPPEKRLLPKAEVQIASGQWPQFQIGAYPYCFKLTEYLDAKGQRTPYEMGQCPGTHWYHAHKHGSTAINVLNGMAGVFVIEGNYDDALVKIYPNLKQTEQVLIVQNFSSSPKLLNQQNATQPPSLWVNGDLNPTITMRPGEIQLWRLVNASVRAVTTLTGFEPKNGVAPEIRQIAQDGVQFHFENFKSPPFIGLLPTSKRQSHTFAPGNRVDILVKAPETAETYVFRLNDTAQGGVGVSVDLLTLAVAGEKIDPPMDFPTEANNYPEFPTFLKDIDPNDIRIYRKLDFGWEAGRSAPGLGVGPIPAAKFTIDGKQFSGGRYDQTMVLGDVEEWTLTNSTFQIAHPFHIHVNPFQVVEIFEPNKDPDKDQVYKPDKNFVWQDVIAIPPSTFDDNGKILRQGYVKIRHRFVDFPGSYVLHCHMLVHEDRGMMQLVRVIPRETIVEHH